VGGCGWVAVRARELATQRNSCSRAMQRLTLMSQPAGLGHTLSLLDCSRACLRRLSLLPSRIMPLVPLLLCSVSRHRYAYSLASVSIFFGFILSLMQCLTMVRPV
jgi:hypothetical protein